MSEEEEFVYTEENDREI